ncbi:PI31 proteasome regulator N-terminal-domain-containing protein [Peziza echinospora]|nr:PI31 proteasome regulator N-terminal-domain-containing protein [Peziza echinospora]
MASNPMSPAALLGLAEASIIPKPSQASSTQAPQTLRNPHDAIALIVHACMLSVGFRLIGFTEDDKLDSPIDGSANLKPLPQKWNAASSYAFRYAHGQSSLEFLIQVNRLGSKAVILGLGLGDEKTASFDISVKDFTSEGFYPFTPNDDEAEAESGGQRRKLRDGFRSETRIAELASLVKTNILHKLIPGLNKPGYQEERPSVPQQSRPQPERPQPQQPPQHDDPLRIFPRPNPYYPEGPDRFTPVTPIPGEERIPGFDDDYEILRPPRSGGGGFFGGPGMPGRNPLSIGEDDRNPPGLGMPFYGGLPGIGRGGGNGMHPTPDHPMFGGRGGGNPRGDDPRFPPGSRLDSF